MEALTPSQLEELFQTNVPSEFQSALVRMLFHSYANSWSTVRDQFDQALWEQAWGYQRWLQVDSDLLSLASRFSRAGAEGRCERNTPGTAMRHAEVQFDRVVITAACVRERGEYPREAKYRSTLAVPNQGILFGSYEREPASPLYAIVLHVPDGTIRQPEHIDIAFPDGDGGFAGGLIPLLERFPFSDATLGIDKEPKVTLRSAVRTGDS